MADFMEGFKDALQKAGGIRWEDVPADIQQKFLDAVMDPTSAMRLASEVHKRKNELQALGLPAPAKNPEAQLDRFFQPLTANAMNFAEWTGQLPNKLVINPQIMQKLSRIDGFYQRRELSGQVSAHSPIIRYINVGIAVVTLQDDWGEVFYHFE